jgi:hypothetical protein
MELGFEFRALCLLGSSLPLEPRPSPTVSPLYPQVLYLQIQLTADRKYAGENTLLVIIAERYRVAAISLAFTLYPV